MHLTFYLSQVLAAASIVFLDNESSEFISWSFESFVMNFSHLFSFVFDPFKIKIYVYIHASNISWSTLQFILKLISQIEPNANV
jgi:hypothetical protein